MLNKVITTRLENGIDIMDDQKFQELSDKFGETFLRTSDGTNLGRDTRSYTKFGIYDEGQGHKEFISVQMIADDSSELIKNTPLDELDDDDFVMDKPMKYDFDAKTWADVKGLTHTISDSSFSFVSEDEFYDELLQAISDKNKLSETGNDATTTLDAE